MAMAVASGGGSGRRRGRRGSKNKPMSEINVTPMVDVMLVLLIIFMVAAPLMTVGVPIDLPKTQAKQLNTEQKPITVSVNNEGLVFVGDTPVEVANVVSAVTAAAANGTEDRIYVRGFRVSRAHVHHGPVWGRISDHAALTTTLERI